MTVANSISSSSSRRNRSGCSDGSYRTDWTPGLQGDPGGDGATGPQGPQGIQGPTDATRATGARPPRFRVLPPTGMGSAGSGPVAGAKSGLSRPSPQSYVVPKLCLLDLKQT